jgi:hypothetical protein
MTTRKIRNYMYSQIGNIVAFRRTEKNYFISTMHLNRCSECTDIKSSCSDAADYTTSVCVGNGKKMRIVGVDRYGLCDFLLTLTWLTTTATWVFRVDRSIDGRSAA